MSDFLTGLVLVVGSVPIILAVAFCLLFLVAIPVAGLVREKLRRWHVRRQVWCVWHINKRVGLIPRSVLEKHSRQFWHQVIKSRAFACLPEVHMHPPEKDVIVLSPDEFKRLPGNLLMESREFFVPKARTPLHEAYERIFGTETK